MTAIRTMNTRYFVDPSIGCASLGLGPDGSIKDISREKLAIVLKEQLFDLANQKFILNLSFRGFAFQMRLKAVVKP